MKTENILPDNFFELVDERYIKMFGQEQFDKMREMLKNGNMPPLIDLEKVKPIIPTKMKEGGNIIRSDIK